MAGSGKIVADDGGRIPADEKSAGITNPIGDVIRFGHEHFNVLRSNQINQSDGRVLVSDKECNTTFLYCGSCDRVRLTGWVQRTRDPETPGTVRHREQDRHARGGSAACETGGVDRGRGKPR